MRARGIAAFVELHIEQGPVLEAEGLALGAVAAINGATRLAATVSGLAGHAGAVPMGLRQDALAASAEMILAIEARARKESDLVATVGRIDAEPGAINVIPGLVRFSVDIRAPRDEWRRRAVSDIAAALQAIADRRKIELVLAPTHEAKAYVCDPASSPGSTRRWSRSARSRCICPPAPATNDDHGPDLPRRHAVRALQRRHQPQSRGIDHGGGLRNGVGRADAVRQGFSYLIAEPFPPCGADKCNCICRGGRAKRGRMRGDRAERDGSDRATRSACLGAPQPCGISRK